MSYKNEVNLAIAILKTDRKFEQFLVTINNIKDDYGLDKDWLAETTNYAHKVIVRDNDKRTTTRRRRASSVKKYTVDPATLVGHNNPKSNYDRKFETDLA